jgi:GNAT superfamily N-acetyltransferase
MQLDGYVVRRTIAADEACIQQLFEADPEYFEIVHGAPPGPAEFQSLLTELAPGKTYDDKFVYSVLSGDEKICAVADMVRNYPEDGIWFVGLLFVARDRRGAGLGTRLVEAICGHIAAHDGHAVRIAVAKNHRNAMQFWARAGFRSLYIAERERAPAAPLTLDVMEWAV